MLEKKPGALLNGAPFAETPLLLVQLQTALRRRKRQYGDRIMAKLLAAVPAHGLETGVDLFVRYKTMPYKKIIVLS